jgi:hypothetical protein
MKMTQAELNEIVRKHGLWLRGDDGGAKADLARADLARADLAGADLAGANLAGADLAGADLAGADLAGANLAGADLAGANLARADLAGANLARANMFRATLDPIAIARLSIVPETGAFEGWKKVWGGSGTAIVRLRIPADAKRSNAAGRKCRASHAVVLEGEGYSGHDNSTVYSPGQTVRAHAWCEDRWKECAGGIHFFLTRIEAEEYDL